MARTAVVAGTATAVAGGVSHHQQQKYAAQSNEQYAEQTAIDSQSQITDMQAQMNAMQAQQAAAAMPAPAAAAPGNDMITQLQQLSAMKNAGVLTDAEFETAKAKLLAS